MLYQSFFKLEEKGLANDEQWINIDVSVLSRQRETYHEHDLDEHDSAV